MSGRLRQQHGGGPYVKQGVVGKVDYFFASEQDLDAFDNAASAAYRDNSVLQPPLGVQPSPAAADGLWHEEVEFNGGLVTNHHASGGTVRLPAGQYDFDDAAIALIYAQIIGRAA